MNENEEELSPAAEAVAEAAAEPAAAPAPTIGPESKFKNRLEMEIHDLGKDAVKMFDKVAEGVEDWYARHYHKAAVEGRTPLSAKDKDELVKTVTASVTR